MDTQRRCCRLVVPVVVEDFELRSIAVVILVFVGYGLDSDLFVGCTLFFRVACDLCLPLSSYYRLGVRNGMKRGTLFPDHLGGSCTCCHSSSSEVGCNYCLNRLVPHDRALLVGLGQNIHRVPFLYLYQLR
jgi:hypothetical protein